MQPPLRLHREHQLPATPVAAPAGAAANTANRMAVKKAMTLNMVFLASSHLDDSLQSPGIRRSPTALPGG